MTHPRYIVQENLEYAEGNPFGQGQNDHCTTENKIKCLASGMQFINSRDLSQHLFALSMSPATNATDIGTAYDVNKHCMTMTGYEYDQICGITIADKAGLGASELFGHKKDPCKMHEVSCHTKVNI